MFGFLLLIAVVGADRTAAIRCTLLWGPGSPLTIAGLFVAAIPVYALWALPTVGWLLLCSAWARSKPFLWAVMIPVFAGIFVSWFDLMHVFDLEPSWFWQNIVARLAARHLPGHAGSTRARHLSHPTALARSCGRCSNLRQCTRLLRHPATVDRRGRRRGDDRRRDPPAPLARRRLTP